MKCAHARWADETTKQIGLVSRTWQSPSWSGCGGRMRPEETKSPLRQPPSRTTTRIERASASMAGFQGAGAGPKRLGSENPTSRDFVGRWGCGRTMNCILFRTIGRMPRVGRSLTTLLLQPTYVCIRTHARRCFSHSHLCALALFTLAAQEPPCARPSPTMWMHR